MSRQTKPSQSKRNRARRAHTAQPVIDKPALEKVNDEIARVEEILVCLDEDLAAKLKQVERYRRKARALYKRRDELLQGQLDIQVSTSPDSVAVVATPAGNGDVDQPASHKNGAAKADATPASIAVESEAAP